LLQLPRELRDEIFRLVLGGHSLHVGYPRRRSSRGPCENALDEIENLATGCFQCVAATSDEAAYHSGSAKEEDWLSWRHEHCSIPAAQTLTLGLLTVCRQIHNENKFISLSANKFSFTRPSSIRGFVDKLCLEQQAALRSVSLYRAHAYRDWEREEDLWSYAYSESLRRPLRLRIFIELYLSDFYDFREESNMVFRHAQDGAVAAWAAFGRLKLRGVEVMVFDASVCPRETWEAGEPREVAIKRWEECIRRMILPSKLA